MEVIYGFQNLDRTNIQEMTVQQALQDDYYHKIYKDNGLIKKIETYKNQNLYAIDYYLDGAEDEVQLLNEFYQLVDYISFFDRKMPLGSYFVERERIYDKSQQVTISRRIRVFDEQNRLVCYVETDNDDNPYIETTQKYLYLNITTVETNGDTTSDLFYLEFEYDDNSQIVGVDVNTGHLVYTEKYLIDNLDDMNEVIERFGSDDYSYYEHPNWMP